MFGLRSLPRRTQALPWTCGGCLKQQKKEVRRPLVKQFATHTKDAVRSRSKTPRRLLITAAVLALGSGAVAFTEQGQFLWGAAQRTGRVVGTLAVCVNEYVVFAFVRLFVTFTYQHIVTE